MKNKSTKDKTIVVWMMKNKSTKDKTIVVWMMKSVNNFFYVPCFEGQKVGIRY